jgi:CheY-like chemotaxis protein
MKPLQVLGVDDDSGVRAVTVGILDALGHRSLGVAEADGALAQLAARPNIDLLITDQMMPGMDGGSWRTR